ncbi:MAG: HDIG domain-containing protein [Candidatus Pacebacteria bacterium]|jgi:putative nucleotidyltransferase with HDIG domain|nr:HDIG domain-containing protein [Candidatus Paceibacterota bacterium]MBT3511712.1 HDIG domain-containing protein [Candidatus Paceibacterota bacterium]MBT4005141.1 HDIG domain-containing protein [Candidatus Paceibacterota bacterium]MBT4358598.1 HDIG domain-containing protein [Candidatus Paceibacterota bacterium]MBT4680738.1 HDIG domain-containing protein [Candidatus Paceibacterota bacterium]
MNLPTRTESQALLAKYVENPALRHHCEMVAAAMEAYAEKFDEDAELWYQTGLLHDLDYEKYPDEHPHKAVNDLLNDYPEELKHAILAHGPGITGVEPETKMERYLFASDELSGFMHAYSLMRPNGFDGMKASKIIKKLRDISFAAKISREDVNKGFEIIDGEPAEHVQFLITVFADI